MSKFTKPVFWAVAILGLAVATSLGLVQREFAQPVIMGLPLVAFFHIYGTQPAAVCGERKA